MALQPNGIIDGFDDYGVTANAAPTNCSWVLSGSDWEIDRVAARTGHCLGSQTNANYLQYTFPASETTFSFGVAVYPAASPSATAWWIEFFDSAAAVQFTLGALSDTVITAWRGAFNTTSVTTGTVPTMHGAWHYLEFVVTMNGSSSTITVNWDGVQIISGTFNIQATGNANCRYVRLGVGPNSGNTVAYDDVYMSDNTAPNTGILGQPSVKTSLMTSNGTHQAWTASSGSAVSCINGNPPSNFSTYISDGTTGDISTFNPVGIGSVGRVLAVCLKNEVELDSGGSRGVTGAIRISGTDYAGSTHSISNTTAGQIYDLWDTNPNTSAAWLTSDVNGAEWGVKVAS